MWKDFEPFKNIRQSHISNRTLSPQKSIAPVSYTGKDAPKLAEADNLISIELCYCSIYDECWLIDRDNRPLSVEACFIEEKQRFLQ